MKYWAKYHLNVKREERMEFLKNYKHLNERALKLTNIAF
jgi:hypothetical protein